MWLMLPFRMILYCSTTFVIIFAELTRIFVVQEGERIFVICEDIDEDLSDELQTLLLHFDSQNSDKPFLFIFDCLGGDVSPSSGISLTKTCFTF